MTRWGLSLIVAVVVGLLLGQSTVRSAESTPTSSTPALPAAAGVKVKLTAAPLLIPGMIFTPREFTRVVRTAKGSLESTRTVKLTAAHSSDVINIGSNQVTVLMNAKGCFLQSGTFSAALHANQRLGAAAADAISIPVPNSKTGYTLMFPSYTFVAGKEVSLTYQPGFAMCGHSGGMTFMLYDDNMDGQFGVTGGTFGITEGDSPVIVFPPQAAHIASAKAIVDVTDVAADGSSLTYQKYSGPVAKVQVAYVADSLEMHAAYKSTDADTAFVVTSSSRGSEKLSVPPGNYQFQYGVVYSPTLHKIAATMSRAELAATDVSSDKETKLALGGPFHLDFVATYDARGSKVNINPMSFRLMGKNGEEYKGFEVSRAAAPQVVMVTGTKQTMLPAMGFT